MGKLIMKRGFVLFLALFLVLGPRVSNMVIAEEDEAYTKVHRPYINGFDDETFRPYENITREQAISVIQSLVKFSPSYAMSPGQLFLDVPIDRWSYGSIINGFKNGLLDPLFDSSFINEDGGRSIPKNDQNFFPTKPLTRGELVGILIDNNEQFYDELPEPFKSMSFTDVKGHRFESQINDVAARGIINGYPDNTFKPDNNISRAEFVKVINTFLNRCDTKTIKEEINVFKDINKKDWFYNDVIEASVTHEYEGEVGNMSWIRRLTDEEIENLPFWM